jgi:hypothetical protein
MLSEAKREEKQVSFDLNKAKGTKKSLNWGRMEEKTNRDLLAVLFAGLFVTATLHVKSEALNSRLFWLTFCHLWPSTSGSLRSTCRAVANVLHGN